MGDIKECVLNAETKRLLNVVIETMEARNGVHELRGAGYLFIEFDSRIYVHRKNIDRITFSVGVIFACKQTIRSKTKHKLCKICDDHLFGTWLAGFKLQNYLNLPVSKISIAIM